MRHLHNVRASVNATGKVGDIVSSRLIGHRGERVILIMDTAYQSLEGSGVGEGIKFGS
jgi:hypothetical protein